MNVLEVILISILFAASVTWILNQLSRMIFGKRYPVRNRQAFALVNIDHWYTETQKNPKKEENKEYQELVFFHNAMLFSQVRIRDCMIPRTEIEAIDINASIEDLQNKFISTGYSKIIVYSEAIDNVVGFISSKQLFKHPVTIEEKISQISFVPETMPANKLLHEFMQYHRSIAVVVDEYGGTSGIVTLEDIMEEIFGEIEDEHDTDDLVEKQINPDEFILSSRLEIEYLNFKYGLNFPESEDYDTLAGFILYRHHSLPKPSDKITIDSYSFKILKVSNTRIELVYLKIDRG
jgi:CBS domain containing-hemolysin-like protein